MKNALRVSIVLLITIFFLVVALWGLDVHEAKEAILTAQWRYFIFVFGCYLLTHATRTLRLWVLLDKKGSFGTIFSINTIGFLAINVIPLRLGEMVRPYLLMEKVSIPFSKGLAAILLERLMDMFMLLIMLFGLTWFVELPEQGVQIGGIDIVSAGQKALAGMVLMGSVVGGGMVLIGERAFSPLRRLPNGEKLVGFALSFREGMSALFSRPLQALLLLGLSACVWATTISAVGFALAAFPSVPTGVGPAWTVWAITLSGMVVAPTPGFIGVYEVFCSAALWLWGVEHTVATTFALALHASQLSFTVVIGAFFLLVEGIALKSVVEASRQANGSQA